MKTRLLTICITLFIIFRFCNLSYALEITDFRANMFGDELYVTIASEDAERSFIASCTVFSNKKPIAKNRIYIDGVGTMTIINRAQIRENLTVSCKEVDGN